jgi:hypothetical protein
MATFIDLTMEEKPEVIDLTRDDKLNTTDLDVEMALFDDLMASPTFSDISDATPPIEFEYAWPNELLDEGNAISMIARELAAKPIDIQPLEASREKSRPSPYSLRPRMNGKVVKQYSKMEYGFQNLIPRTRYRGVIMIDVKTRGPRRFHW